MSNTNTSILPVVKSEWQGQLNALRQANKAAGDSVLAIERQMSESSSLTTTLQPQLEQAQLAQWESVQKYNSFVESGSQLLKVATDADNRLKSNNLSLLERNQLQTTRDTMVDLASEFITFKSQNGASLQSLSPMNIGSKTYYHDGRVEWNLGTTGGILGQGVDTLKDIGAAVKEVLIKGPLTPEQNYAACQSALSALLPDLAGKIIKPLGGLPDIVHGEMIGQAINAADPAGQMCRYVYPKGQSPQELYRLGQVIEGGDFTAVLIAPDKLSHALMLNAFADPQVQALWSGSQASELLGGLTGSAEIPFADAPNSLTGFSALAPVWDNPQWSIQLASAGGIESDAGNGLFGGGTNSIYSLADGRLLGMRDDSGAGVLLGADMDDHYFFGSGSSLTFNNSSFSVFSNNQTTTRNWFADSIYQTDTFVGPLLPSQPLSTPATSSLSFGAVKYDMNNFDQRLDAEAGLYGLTFNGGLGSSSLYSFTNSTSNFLLGGGGAFNTVKLPSSSNYVNPGNIGAFYESVSAGLDAAESIAAKTPVVLDGNLQGVSAAQLAARDAQGSGSGNGSGVLSGQELSGLSFWSDLNEDGFVDAGELTAVSSAVGSLLARDYGFYTGGNSQRGAGVAGTPVHGGVAPIVAVPNSNYRSLRDTDNRYWVSGSRWIDFASNQVKVNNGTRNTLIGTDGNDKFDANYYANYAQWINSGLLVNFLAGGGNDEMGGSSRADNLWGGTGDDTLLGYAGDDKLYGEEGNDFLQGDAGNDTLNGGAANDRAWRLAA